MNGLWFGKINGEWFGDDTESESARGGVYLYQPFRRRKWYGEKAEPVGDAVVQPSTKVEPLRLPQVARLIQRLARTPAISPAAADSIKASEARLRALMQAESAALARVSDAARRAAFDAMRAALIEAEIAALLAIEIAEDERQEEALMIAIAMAVI